MFFIVFILCYYSYRLTLEEKYIEYEIKTINFSSVRNEDMILMLQILMS